MALQLSLYQYSAIGFLLLAFYFTLSIYSLILYGLALSAGYVIAPFLVKRETIDALQDFAISHLDLGESPPPEPTKPAPIIVRKNRTISSASTNTKVNIPPWETLEVSSRINEAAEELILLIIDNYINKWYKSEISAADNAFVGEIQYQIRHAASLILRESKNFDFSSFILEDWLPLALIHIDRICRHIRKDGKESTPPSLIEIEILQDMPDLHIAMQSRENENDYLRVVADFLVERLVDETRVGGRSEDREEHELSMEGMQHKNRSWPSQCVRHFLRELVLSTIMIPLMDFVSNPDTLNNILLGIIHDPNGPTVSAPKVDTKEIKSKFLAKLTDFSHGDTPDSLLALKLSDVMREPRLMQLFMFYLHDIRGPEHFMDCFHNAHDLHNDIHRLEENEKMFEELHHDVWTLYSDYIHESAPQRIRFDNCQIPSDFQKAVESKDPILMKKVAEDVYKELYHRLNYQYLIPFCQSECYLGYLCGAPPDVVELIRGPKDEEQLKKHRPPTESSFSLSQFRNKLLNAFSSSQTSLEENDYGEEADGIQEEKVAADVRVKVADIALVDTEKDLNKWIITVPLVEQRKDVSGRIYFVYIIQIERLDISNDANSGNSDTVDFPSTWIITRKYDEFHILEKKLQECYGNSIRLGMLPDKRSLHQKNPTFMDTQRLQFEKFLQGLALQPAMKKSELLYAFLTTDEELREEDLSFLSDLNPFKVMAKVPGKLQRERGQNLKPFLLNVLANILAPSSFFSESPTHGKEATSDQSSLKSFGSDASLFHPQISSKIALDNLLLTQKRASEVSQLGMPQAIEPRPAWTKDTSTILQFFVIQIGYGISDFFVTTFLLFQQFFDRIFKAIIKRQIKKCVEKVIEEESILYLIQSFQNMLQNQANPATDEEKKLRAELCQRRIDRYLEEAIPLYLKEIIGTKNFRQIAADIVRSLQLPRLNKQLSFVLLDALIEKIRGNTNSSLDCIPKM